MPLTPPDDHHEQSPPAPRRVVLTARGGARLEGVLADVGGAWFRVDTIDLTAWPVTSDDPVEVDVEILTPDNRLSGRGTARPAGPGVIDVRLDEALHATERRRAPRVLVRLPVRVTSGRATVQGWTVDLSEGGARLQLPRHLEPGSELTVVIGSVAFPSIVLPDRPGDEDLTRVRFLQMPAEARVQLVGWIHAAPAHRPGDPH